MYAYSVGLQCMQWTVYCWSAEPSAQANVFMLIYVFGFVLPFAKSAHVFQKLSLTRFADFVSNY